MTQTPNKLFLSMAAAVTLSACGRSELAGPPELRLGRDECAECGMLIDDDRCASALLIERDGRREHIVFDDLGCMLDHEREHGSEFAVVEGFARDHDAQLWISTRVARFVVADHDKLRTPMGSGMVAVADDAAAKKKTVACGGSCMNYLELGAARRTWKEARYGKPHEKP